MTSLKDITNEDVLHIMRNIFQFTTFTDHESILMGRNIFCSDQFKTRTTVLTGAQWLSAFEYLKFKGYSLPSTILTPKDYNPRDHDMVNEMGWDEFRKTGLLLFINQILHIFGWAIVLEIKEFKVVRAYPSRVKYRGFYEEDVAEAYKKVSSYMVTNANDLLNETYSTSDVEK